jgi:XisI protein
MHNEWRGENRIYGCAMQLDIIDNQIWIQQNNTEIYVDRELIQRGVLPKDIILGFRSPSIRQLLAATHK